MSAWFVQIWVRCEHVDCDAQVDMMVDFHLAVSKNTVALPPGWSHHTYEVGDTANPERVGCFSASALCPKHALTPCPHTDQ